jgi:hypothetical protein
MLRSATGFFVTWEFSKTGDGVLLKLNIKNGLIKTKIRIRRIENQSLRAVFSEVQSSAVRTCSTILRAAWNASGDVAARPAVRIITLSFRFMAGSINLMAFMSSLGVWSARIFCFK